MKTWNEKIDIFKTESLLLFSEVYIFCTNMCFLTTVYVLSVLKSDPTKTMSSESPKTLFEDQCTANIFIDKNTIFQLCPNFQSTGAVKV